MKEHVYIVKQIQPYTKVLHVCKSLAKAERLVERIIGAVYNHEDKTYKNNCGSFVIEKLEVFDA